MLYCERSPSKSVEKLNESKYKVAVLGAHLWNNLASERVGPLTFFSPSEKHLLSLIIFRSTTYYCLNSLLQRPIAFLNQRLPIPIQWRVPNVSDSCGASPVSTHYVPYMKAFRGPRCGPPVLKARRLITSISFHSPGGSPAGIPLQLKSYKIVTIFSVPSFSAFLLLSCFPTHFTAATILQWSRSPKQSVLRR